MSTKVQFEFFCTKGSFSLNVNDLAVLGSICIPFWTILMDLTPLAPQQERLAKAIDIFDTGAKDCGRGDTANKKKTSCSTQP